MKYSIEQANKLLKKLGVNAQVVEDDKADKDLDVDTAADEFLSGIKESNKGELEKSTLEELEKVANGKARGAMASALARTLALGTGARGDLEKFEKYDEMAKHAKGLYDENINKTQQQWEKERQEYEDKIEALTTEHETTLTNKDSEWQKKYDSHFINTSLIDLVSKLPKKGGDVVEMAETLLWKLQKDGYEPKYNHDKKTFEVLKDGKPAKDFDPVTYGKTWLEKNNNLASDTRDLKPKEIPTRRQDYGEGVEKVPEHNGSQNFAELAAEL